MIMLIRILLIVALVFRCSIATLAQVTLDECVSLAQANYPLISKYGVLRSLQDVSLSDIGKSWLPQISAYGQGTTQNVVPSLPEGLSQMLKQAGADLPGMSRLQYKLGVELNQMVWDGGENRSRRKIERAETTERQAELDVQMYAVRERVENLFFNILLVDEQIKQTCITEELLKSNLMKLRSMKTNGVAMQSDVDMVEARLLALVRQLTQLQSLSDSYRRMMEIYIGCKLDGRTLVKPKAVMPDNLSPDRPEQRLFKARMLTNEVRESSIRATLMPRVGLFAQAYYGYPGFDYFKSMTSREPSANVMAGLKMSWTIGGLYSKRNTENRLRLSTEGISSDCDVFLFNTNLQIQSQTDNIRAIEQMMKEDGRIVELNEKVRRAAESQLNNGVIDATALLTKLTDENQARLTMVFHEIQLIQSIYQLKHILNR